jgi:hypothetical protein
MEEKAFYMVIEIPAGRTIATVQHLDQAEDIARKEARLIQSHVTVLYFPTGDGRPQRVFSALPSDRLGDAY